jgi:hypothetical protein
VVNVTGRGTGNQRVPASTIWHMPMTAVIDRDAFVPYLFSGLTTIRVQPGLRTISTPNGLPLSPSQLLDGLSAAGTTADDPSDGEGGGGRIYWRNWPKNFEYVLVQRFGADPGTLPPNLHLMTHAADMDLYRVVP